VLELLYIRKQNKAPRNNLISNDFLKAISKLLAKALAALTTAC